MNAATAKALTGRHVSLWPFRITWRQPVLVGGSRRYLYGIGFWHEGANVFGIVRAEG